MTNEEIDRLQKPITEAMRELQRRYEIEARPLRDRFLELENMRPPTFIFPICPACNMPAHPAFSCACRVPPVT